MVTLRRGEELAVLRVGDWRCLVPARFVDRVLSAAAPIAVPGADPPGRLVIRIGDELLPLAFGSALLGSDAASLRASDKMVVLSTGHLRFVLWVDAVEDLVAHDPLESPTSAVQPGAEWICGFSAGGRTLPVLDVERVAHAACEAPKARPRPPSGTARHGSHPPGR